MMAELSTERPDITPDAVHSWVDRLPLRLQPYARLARFDRPAGMWLLFWPCLWGTFLASPPGWWRGWPLYLVGAVAMRSAGCVYNDIVDRDLDRKVARTAARPVASGAVSVKAAWLLLLLLSLIGFGVFILLPTDAKIAALCSIVLVAGYPFMKRITWWPQAWLGLTFNWGIPVGYFAAVASLRAPLYVMLMVYAAGVLWTLAYDTIYAVQDIEDDALAGVKSSARALGGHLRLGIWLFFIGTFGLLVAAMILWTGKWQAALWLAPVGAHFLWQAATFDPADTHNALHRFRSNFRAGALIAMAFAVIAILYA